jgi:parvulin-like peptidyl-prolyl isomerase
VLADTFYAHTDSPTIRFGFCGRVPWVSLVVVLTLQVGIVLANDQPAMQDRGSDEIARVNGVVIPRSEFQTFYRQAVDRHAREGHPVDETHLAPLRRRVVQRMVEEELLVQESRRLGIMISNDEIDQDMAVASTRFENPAAFRQALERQHWDEIQYRRHLKRQRAIDRLLAREVDPVVTVSEEEIRHYYAANRQRFHIPEKIRVRHIVIRKNAEDEKASTDSAYRQITMIKEKLDQGGDFAALAEQYSQEPAREQGGDLGFIQRDQMPPSIAPVVFDLAVGEISPILTTANGYYLIQVTERLAAHVISFEEARTEIQKTLLQVKQEQAVRAYIDVLRKRADIQAAQ